jgi:hypothetical protein
VRALLIGGCLVATVAVAIVLRFAALDVNPGGLYVDEAAEALSAQRLLHEPGYRPVFFPDGGGREALFGYLVAAAFGLVGDSVVVLRGVAAAIGVLAVGAIWFLGRRFGEVAALVGAGWAAGSLWLVCISRDGMRNMLVPLFGALALAALIAWQQRPGRASALLAGAATAIAALYTYQPLKLLPLLVVVWIWSVRRTDPTAYAGLRRTLAVAAGAFLVVATPMLVAAALDPSSYFGRAVGVSLVTNPISQLPEHWLRTLGMFAVTGDPNPRHNVGGTPLLGWLVAAVAAIGVAVLWRRRQDPAHALVLWSLPIFLIPPLLATEGGAPHFLRALGLAAPLSVSVGMGVAAIADWVEAHRGRTARTGVVAAAALGLMLLAFSSGAAYLSRPPADRYDAYDYALVALAEAADSGDIVIVDAYSSGVVRFMAAPDLPSFVEPGMALPDARAGTTVFALSLDELATALGAKALEAARVVATDPEGDPRVWAVTR